MNALLGLLYGMVVGIVLIVLFEGIGMIHFHYTSDYETPWYDQHWYKDPTRHLILGIFGTVTRDAWVYNYPHTEHWHVIEHTLGSKQYWTIVEKEDVE